MNLKASCKHDFYDEHPLYEPVYKPNGEFIDNRKVGMCPGGTLLPSGSFSEFEMEGDDGIKRRYLIVALDALAAAQPGRDQ